MYAWYFNYFLLDIFEIVLNLFIYKSFLYILCIFIYFSDILLDFFLNCYRYCSDILLILFNDD